MEGSSGELVSAGACRLVLITAPAEAAATLAEAIVQERLAACVNQLGPVRSLYWWQGKMESAAEVLLLVKTSVGQLEALLAKVQELHPYEVPEFLALPLSEGARSYVSWLGQELDAACSKDEKSSA